MTDDPKITKVPEATPDPDLASAGKVSGKGDLGTPPDAPEYETIDGNPDSDDALPV
jgi:hypothetical protein